MAQLGAFVNNIEGSGKNEDGDAVIIITTTFFGTDVPVEVEGRAYRDPIALAGAFTLATLKSSIVFTVTARALALGLVINPWLINIVSYEQGGP